MTRAPITSSRSLACGFCPPVAFSVCTALGVEPGGVIVELLRVKRPLESLARTADSAEELDRETTKQGA